MELRSLMLAQFLMIKLLKQLVGELEAFLSARRAPAKVAVGSLCPERLQ